MSINRGLGVAILITLLGLIFIGANAEPFGRIFWHLLTIYDQPAAWLMLLVLATGYMVATRSSGDGLWVDRMLHALDRQRNPIAILLWIGLCVGSLFVYRNHPLSMDEYAAVFQARIFAAGALHGQFPPDLLDNLIPKGFQNHFLMVNHHTGAVFSAYWPGFSLLLTPFVLLGIPWACNPMLVAASLLLIARIARELIPSSTAAGWAMLFALASPAFVANGITYYSMPAHLLLNLGFVWLLLSKSPLRLFLAGLVGGFALVLHNPFPHLIFALPWIAWIALKSERRFQDLFWLAAGYLPIVALLGAGWSMWQQQVLHAGAAVPVAQQVLGAEPDLLERGARLAQGFLRVLQMPDERVVYARLGGLTKLWLWASPMLLLLAWWGGRGAKHIGVRMLGASALTTFFAYFLIRFDQGHGWGYRYFHSAWGVLPILGAAGAAKLGAMTDAGVRWTRMLAAVALLSLLTANGLRFYQIDNFVSHHLAQFPPQAANGQQLVMHNGRGYYAYDLIQNDPWLRGDSVTLLVQSEEDRAKLLARFHDRLSASAEPLGNRFGKTYTLGAKQGRQGF